MGLSQFFELHSADALELGRHARKVETAVRLIILLDRVVRWSRKVERAFACSGSVSPDSSTKVRFKSQLVRVSAHAES